MPYLSYMMNHYQHARYDQANDSKPTKYIQQYGYWESSIKSEATRNEMLHMIPRKDFVLSAILILRIR
jgi:hypothetical protein